MLHTEILHYAEMLFQDSQIMYENHRASKADNDWLRDLLNDFFLLLRQGKMPKIACFYEEKTTDLGLFLKNKVSCPSIHWSLVDLKTGRLHSRAW
jgi:hypothetical protein